MTTRYPDGRGGNYGNIVDLSNDLPPPRFRLLIAHTLGRLSPAAPVLFEPRESASRTLRLAGCSDCTGQPQKTVTTPPGFAAAVVIEHDLSCPAMAEALASGQR